MNPSVDVVVDDRDATVAGGSWIYGFDRPTKPYCHPVRTPSGHVLTRDGTATHWWQHGLWFVIKFVNGDNFWEEIEPFGTVRHVGVPAVDGPSLTGALQWVAPDGTVVLDEHRRLRHVPLDADSYAIDFHLELTARVEAELERTPHDTWGGYSGLAFRGRDDIHSTRFLLDGVAGELGAVVGERGRWLDLSGLAGAGGDAPVGIALLDTPANPSHPTPWYGHTSGAVYGEQRPANFANAAFLWDGGRRLQVGETLPFDYRVVVHDGIWTAADVDAAYDAWVGDVAG